MYKFNVSREFAIRYLSPLLMGIIGAVITQSCFLLYQNPTISTVNITGMVTSFIKETANQNLTEDQKKQRITQFGAVMQRSIDDVSQNYHTVILPSEAVIAGSHDLTHDVMQTIKKRMQ